MTETSDIIDGHGAHLVEPGDRLLTSDAQDMRRLLGLRADRVTVITV